MNTTIIQTKELTKNFGNFTAVDGISFEVYRGEIFGFLGANGAGKTTAIKMLTGLIRPSYGQATVLEYDVYHQSEFIKRSIGYMSQRFSLYEDLTILENMKFYGSIYGLHKKEIESRSHEILNYLDLTRHKNQLVKSLPLGWKQKLAFSVSIFHQPRLVFLDEPTGGVDPITRREFWELILEYAAQGNTVFVTTHYLDEAEYCSRVSIMVDGRIVALGSPDMLKNTYHEEHMERVFLKLVEAK
ncbi:MAG: ABC transporter ATP-binding protein [Saprospiraceae bacterium]|nr:ABC transporter ATP-binding protein [Saprospiraceae bacterium]